jgi:hypothetical protein
MISVTVNSRSDDKPNSARAAPNQPLHGSGEGARKKGVISADSAPPAPSNTVSGWSSSKPRIPRPQDGDEKSLEGLDVDSIMNLLGSLNTDASNAQVRAAYHTIDAKKNARLDMSKKVQDMIDEAKKKADEAKAAIEEAKKAGWVNTALEVLGAAAGVLAALACPALAAVAVAGVILAADSLANQIIQQEEVKVDGPGGPDEQLDISIGGLVNMAFNQAIKDGNIGVTNEKGQYVDAQGNVITDPSKYPKANALKLTTDELVDVKTYVTLGLNIAIAAAMMVGGARGLTTLSKAATQAAEGANTAQSILKLSANAERAAHALSIVSDLGSGTASIVQGNFQLDVADANRVSADAQAFKIVFDAMLTKLGQDMNMDQDVLRDALKWLNSNYDLLSEAIAAVVDGSIRTAHYM